MDDVLETVEQIRESICIRDSNHYFHLKVLNNGILVLPLIIKVRLADINEIRETVINPNKAGGAIMPPPPSTIFLIAQERIWMAPRRSLTFFFQALRNFKNIFLKIGPTVTRSRDLLSLHVSLKIAHFRDLCTKRMAKSFFLKTDQTWVIGS